MKRFKRWWRERATKRRRLAILDAKLEERDLRIDQLEATIAAYERAVSGRPPGCAGCQHQVVEHRHNGPCQHPGCNCPDYDSSDPPQLAA